jgi:hypothetical protein
MAVYPYRLSPVPLIPVYGIPPVKHIWQKMSWSAITVPYAGGTGINRHPRKVDVTGN